MPCQSSDGDSSVGYSSMSFSIFTKGQLLLSSFALLGYRIFPEGVYSYRKEFAFLGAKILFMS